MYIAMALVPNTVHNFVLSCAGPTAVRATGSEYRIGTNFCLDFEGPLQRTSATIDCQIVQRSSKDNIPGAFPIPDHTWDREGIILYSAIVQDPNPLLEMDFFMENPYLMPGLVDPAHFPLAFLKYTGSLRFNHLFTNLSMAGMMADVYPANISVRDAQRLVFNNILGTWTCTANNSLGGESCSSTIRECGKGSSQPDVN